MSNSRSNVPQALRNIGITNMNITIIDDNSGKFSFTKLPPEIGLLKNLRKLKLFMVGIDKLPPEIFKLTKLEELTLNRTRLTEIQPEIGKLTKLVKLNLRGNYLITLPPEIGKLENLMLLELQDNELTSIPPQIGNLKNLRFLSLYGPNFLTELPSSIGNLEKLQSLYLEGNYLKSLPSSIGNLKNLESLNLDNNYLKSLPSSIGNLKKLKFLMLNSNPSLRIIPRSLDRSGLRISKSSSTKFEIVIKPVQRRNVPLNTNRNDPISGYNFSVGNKAVNLGYNRYLTEKSLLNWIKTKNNNTNITNINTLYSLDPNTKIVINPFTKQPLFRRNLNFVKFVKPNTPNTLAKNLNKTKINNKPNSPKTVRKKAGNAAQSRRNNVNNNNR